MKKQVEKICERCGVIFSLTPSRAAHSPWRFCSEACRRPPIFVECGQCKKLMRIEPGMVKRGADQYCSRSCLAKSKCGERNGRWVGGLVELLCARCGKSFHAKPIHARTGRAKYCSQSCLATERSIGPKNNRWSGGPVEFSCILCGKVTMERRSRIGRKQFCSQSCRTIHTIKAMKLQRTKPELAMRRWLDCVGVEYLEQYPIPKVGIADFFLPSLNLAIEVDGVWWHSQPRGVANDKRKNAAYARAGIEVLRIPDSALI